MPVIYINLVFVYLSDNRYFECFQALKKLKGFEMTCNSDVWTLYHALLLYVMIHKFNDVESITEYDKDTAEECIEFITFWIEHWALLFQTDIAFYVSVVSALWCLKVVEKMEWPQASLYFKRCSRLATTLLDKLHFHSQWSVAGILIFCRLRISQEDRQADGPMYLATKNFIMARLEKMNKIIRYHFPIFQKKYEILKYDISNLDPKDMLHVF
ncbi:uncharacterized protein CEXT_586671 [Caerostris extrusa]|uniref:Uncharacterized protein n=1 Tax=Caerostris extrusa TaxID=172846 RepID=A0AAV4T0F2_CAEEX|nr:uncharacterized protein CEXT_586671 [Caerostris extrusa]